MLRLPSPSLALAPILCLLAAGASRAQSVTAPRLGAAYGNDQDAALLGAPALRRQIILDPGSFARPSPFLCRGIELRLAELARGTRLGGQQVELELLIAHAPVSVHSRTASSLFTNNIDSKTQKLVIARKKLFLPRVGGGLPFQIRLPFDASASFLHIPGNQRSLVLELRIYSNQHSAWLNYPVEAIKDSGRVDFPVLPKACPTASNYTPTQFSGSTNLFPGASNHGHYGYTGMARTPCLGVLGFSDKNYGPLKLPFDLSALGAPGCSIGCSLDWVQSGVTNAIGKISFPLAYPADRRLAGFVFFTQILILDRRANALGIASSPLLKLRLGGDPEATILTNMNSATAISGQLRPKFAPIIRFR